MNKSKLFYSMIYTCFTVIQGSKSGAIENLVVCGIFLSLRGPWSKKGLEPLVKSARTLLFIQHLHI